MILKVSTLMSQNLRCFSVIAVLLPYAIVLAPSQAAISTSGSVLNNPPVGGGSFPSTEVVVGDANDNDSSIVGTMLINDSTDLLLDRLIIGDEEAYIGDVVVTGAGTTLTLDSSFVSNPALQVGHGGTGFLTVSAQAILSVSDANGNLAIGRDATSAGFVTVDGLLTQLAFGEDLIVGEAGYGELKITGGAWVYTLDPPLSTAKIGAVAGGVGLVEVDGDRSLWKLPETVDIGVTGTGALRISNGGVVDGNDGFSSGITVGTTGTIDLDDGHLLVDNLIVNGRLAGNGLVSGPVTVSTAGEVGASAGQKLSFTGAVTNAGVINVSGNSSMRAEVEFAGTLTNSFDSPSPGRIAVADGAVRFVQPLSNNGTIASTSGASDYHGDITNTATGVIAIGGGSNATFYGDVDVTAGTLHIAAGSTALFLSDISISAGANLAIALDPSSLEEGFSTPLQGLNATIDSLITLSLAEGFVPTLGDEFELISTTQGLAISQVDPNNFETLPTGLQWDVLQTGNTLTAIVIGSGSPGDFDNDGDVDGQDFLAWQRNPSIGNLADWQQHYGSPPPLTFVPEPSTLILLLGLMWPVLRR